MTTILYREITSDGQHTEIIEEFSQLDLKKFAEACGQSPEWVLQLLEYDILPSRPAERIHQFLVKMSVVHAKLIGCNVTLMPALLQSQ